jgi:gluconolactonase
VSHPSERILYINDSRVVLIRAYDVLDDGRITNGRLFCVLKDERPGVPDGMKVALDGNLYSTGPGRVWIIAPSGKHLGSIALGAGRRTTNLAWGGGDWRTLFITTCHGLAGGPTRHHPSDAPERRRAEV